MDLGPVETYSKMILSLFKNQKISREEIVKKFVNLQYKRNNFNFTRGSFRLRGDIVEIFPAHLEHLLGESKCLAIILILFMK